jgi:hypothetical protein
MILLSLGGFELARSSRGDGVSTDDSSAVTSKCDLQTYSVLSPTQCLNHTSSFSKG